MEPYSSTVLWIVIVSFIIAFLLAFGVGANDVANSFGTSVGTRVLTLQQACLLASIFEVAGAILVGYGVSETVRKGIVDVKLFEGHEKELMLGSLAALIGSALWNIIATLFSMPISGTHTVVGATIGFALIDQGVDGINWKKLGEIVASWFISPLMSGIISFLIFIIVRYTVLQAKNPQKSGRLLLPFFFGFTVLVNIFSIVLHGPELLRLNDIPVWAAVVIAIGFGVITAILIQVLLVPRVKRKQRTGATELHDNVIPNVTGLSINRTNGETNANFIGDEIINNEPIANNLVKDADALSTGIYGAVTPLPTESPNEQSEQEKTTTVEDIDGEAIMFAPLQILSACFGSFAHGGNDVSNAIGPLTAVWLIYKEGTAVQNEETPIYILLYGGVGIVVGLWALGRRVMRTIGEDLTQLTPASGFAIELGSAATVLIASKIGLPISTTHCKVGSVILVGWGRSSTSGVSWKLFGGIAAAWLITVPFAAGASAAVMAIFRAVAL